MIGLGAIVASPICGSEQSQDFARLLNEYRTGDADRAVRDYALWSADRIRREVRESTDVEDPWSRAAVVMLNTEAGLLPNSGRGAMADSFGLPDERLAVIDWRPENGEPRFRMSFAVIEGLIDDALQRQDERLLRFCRDWSIVVSAVGARRWNISSTSAVPDLVGRRLTSDARIELLLGSVAQHWLRPRVDDRWRRSFGGENFFDPRSTTWIASPFGDHSADTARRAEHDFRDALELDPTLIEARLRLGHVRLLMNRRRAAEADLVQAVGEAQAAGEPFLAYVGTLLLGRLDEIRDRPAEALERYRSATAIQPGGTAARIALGQALIASGRVEDGWTETRRVFGDIGDPRPAARDPWSIYPAAQYWRIDDLLAKLRAMVSQSPRRLVPDPSNAALTPGPIDEPVPPAASAQQQGDDRPGFRLGVDGVRVDALVTEDGQPVTGLDAQHFEVRDGGVTQRIETVSTAGALHAVLLLDMSSGMGLRRWPLAVTAAASAVLPALRPDDVMSLVTVSDRIRLRAHRIGDPAALRRALTRVQPEPLSKTALWDSVFAAQSLVADAPGRPVVVLISDGGDNASWFERGRALERLAQTGIIVDAIQVASSSAYTWNGDVAFGDLSLQPLEDVAGGLVLNTSDNDLAAKIAARFAALRSSYVLLYQPTNVRRGDGWHEIEVRLRNGARGRVQARSGYYSPPVR